MAAKVSTPSRSISLSKIPKPDNKIRLWTREGVESRQSPARLRRISSLMGLSTTPSRTGAAANGSSPTLKPSTPIRARGPPVPPKPGSSRTPGAARVSGGAHIKRRRSQSVGSLLPRKKSKIPVPRYKPAVAARIFLLQLQEEELRRKLEGVRRELSSLRQQSNRANHATLRNLTAQVAGAGSPSVRANETIVRH